MSQFPGLVSKDFSLGSSGIPKYEEYPATGVFVLEKREEKVEPWLWWGIFIHRYLEYVQTRGRAEALAYIEHKFPRGLGACRKIDTTKIPRGDPEVSLAHDVYERRSSILFGRARAKAGSETYGRADLIFKDTTKDGRLHIVDYKTGNATPDKTPVGNTQLLGLAAALRDLDDWKQPIDVSIVAVPSSGELVWRTIELSQEELHEFAVQSRRVHLQVMETRRDYHERGIPPAFNLSEHCKWCSLKPHCPAQPKQELGVPHTIAV